MNAYTPHDTPAIVRRIKRDLDHVVREVRKADPGLRALVLTGGFARAEGAVRNGDPQNDYDLVAVRGLRPPRQPYDVLRKRLEAEIGLHLDLAPVSYWRLPWVSPSIFWYETALRGSVLWGEDVLAKIRATGPEDLRPDEGMRLLVNRAAGLLLARDAEAEEKRLQASKALLASMDVHLLHHGTFPPSQTERWQVYRDLVSNGGLSDRVAAWAPWYGWAFRRKTTPDDAPAMDGDEAWTQAAEAVLEAVPVALRHAGLRSLGAYARRDRTLDRIHFWRNAAKVPGVRRWLSNPTSQVRVATLRMLEATAQGRAREGTVSELAPFFEDDDAMAGQDELQLLERLRSATLQ